MPIVNAFPVGCAINPAVWKPLCLMTPDTRAILLAQLRDDPHWQRERDRIMARQMPPRRKQNRLDETLERIAMQRGLVERPEPVIRYSDEGIV